MKCFLILITIIRICVTTSAVSSTLNKVKTRIDETIGLAPNRYCTLVCFSYNCSTLFPPPSIIRQTTCSSAERTNSHTGDDQSWPEMIMKKQLLRTHFLFAVSKWVSGQEQWLKSVSDSLRQSLLRSRLLGKNVFCCWLVKVSPSSAYTDTHMAHRLNTQAQLRGGGQRGRPAEVVDEQMATRR